MNPIFHFSMSSYISRNQLPLTIVPVKYGTGQERCFHDHDMSEIALILHGPSTHILGRQAVRLQRGDILLIHPGNIHAYDHTEKLELINILYDSRKLFMPALDGYSMHFFSRFFPDYSEGGKSTAEPILHLDQEIFDQVVRLAGRMEEEQKWHFPGYELSTLALFMELLIFLCRQYPAQETGREQPFLIGRILEYLNCHYSEEVSIDYLVAQSYMSRSSFFQKFKQTLGLTPIQYLNNFRLRQAQQLLCFDALSISDIALRCGFHDSNYFCRKFREQFGISPLHFRRQFQKNKKLDP